MPTTTTTRPRAPRAGISLVGVLLGVCGIALLAIWAIPAFFEREGVTLDSVCLLLARDVRSAQNRATLLRSEAKVVFDRDGWHALGADGQPLMTTGEEHQIVRRFSSDGVFDGVTIERIDSSADGELAITAHGTIARGIELELRFRDEQRTVRIERGSGQVVVVGRDQPLLRSLK